MSRTAEIGSLVGLVSRAEVDPGDFLVAGLLPGWWVGVSGGRSAVRRRWVVAEPDERGAVAWAVPGGLRELTADEMQVWLVERWAPAARTWLEARRDR